jgi:holo-[acyl-carrier protein] synthase
MERALTRHPSFATKVFTEEERSVCEAVPRPPEHYAARFAARRAVLKALELTSADGVRLHDVSVGLSDAGRPVALLDGVVRDAAQKQGVTEIALSLSFTHEVATAMALLVTDEVRPKAKEERDPKAEMLASFKQARSVIDELERLQGDLSGALE